MEAYHVNLQWDSHFLTQYFLKGRKLSSPCPEPTEVVEFTEMKLKHFIIPPEHCSNSSIYL